MTWRDHLRPDLPPAMPPRFEGVLLDSNECALGPDEEERALYDRALYELAWNRYPDHGATALRWALADHLGVLPDEILVGNGSIAIVATLMTALRPGARVLLPAPTFDQYAVQARLHGLATVTVPLGEDFALDERATAEAIDREHPALAFFASPNNPTGNCLDPSALVRLARRMGSIFVVDEAYGDYAGRTLLPAGPREVPGLFVMRTLSKVGLAGLRLGFLVGEPGALAAIERASLPFSVGAAAQAIGCAALSVPGAIAARTSKVVRLREQLEADLARIPGVRVYPSQASFVLIRLDADAGAVHRSMLASGISVRDVSAQRGLEGCLRITVGTRAENVRCAETLGQALRARAPEVGRR